MPDSKASQRPFKRTDLRYLALVVPILAIIILFLGGTSSSNFRSAIQLTSQLTPTQDATSHLATTDIDSDNVLPPMDVEGDVGAAAGEEGATTDDVQSTEHAASLSSSPVNPSSRVKSAAKTPSGGLASTDRTSVHYYFGKNQDEFVEDVLASLGNCTSLQCAITANDRLRSRTRFHLPHFIMAGWPRSGGKQVLDYLSNHPQFLRSQAPNPHYFTVCKADPESPLCALHGEGPYLREVMRIKEAAAMRLEVATADSSDDYAARGAIMARRLYRMFPWIKIVLMMREPFSRVVTQLRTASRHELGMSSDCPPGTTSYVCILEKMSSEDGLYYEALQGWLYTFPTDQIFVMQYEEMKENPKKVMYELRLFLGLDPDSPELEFPVESMGSGRDPDPVDMGKGQYLRLARLAKEDALRATNMMLRYGLVDKTKWMARWEPIWRGNEARCTEDQQCKVILGLD